MKLRSKAFFVCLILMCLISIIDMFTTIIALELFNLQETNLWASIIIHNYRLIGYIISLFVLFIIFYVLLFSICFIIEFFYRKITQKNLKNDYVILVYITIMVLYLLSDFFVIINNVLQILMKGGII